MSEKSPMLRSDRNGVRSSAEKPYRPRRLKPSFLGQIGNPELGPDQGTVEKCFRILAISSLDGGQSVSHVLQ